MFHTIITLAYIIPNIYLFIRIWQLFIHEKYKIHYILIYLILFLVYPLSRLDDRTLPSDFFAGISDYLLPFFLNLFVFVLLFDILLIPCRIFRIRKFKIRKSPGFKRISLAVILSLSISVVIAGIINFNTIRISQYNIKIPGRYSVMNHLRIAFASDFHLRENTSVSFVEKFVEKIKAANPDIMIFGGDIAEGDRRGRNMLIFAELFRQIKPGFGVFTVLGNHEYYSGHDDGSFFDMAGIKVLCDTIVRFDNCFSLGGRYDSHFSRRKQVEDLMMTASDSLPVIMVDHRPTEIDQVSRTSVDVQLSGHTHNGQMFPINLITKSIYQLSWGYMKKNNTHFFVSSGIRLWGPPVRTAGKSEIMVIDIEFSGR
jgi:uncharacterized protein